uniref:Methyltransferase type 11 domain-containing protein n=1 Tax=Panagrolaimus sp. PS1159 TaxID=55785 RepID=A0AC35GW47_9BILA
MTCNEIFDEWQKVADNGLTIDPPKEIPKPSEFLLNNYTRLEYYYWNQTPKNTNGTLEYWNQTYIENLVKAAKINPSKVPLSYLDECLSVYTATKHFGVKDKIGAVIGSQQPWAEVFLLANGVKHITTVDYYQLSINHPKMDFLYAPDLPSKKEKYYGKFDFIVAFSSIEHSGLGRYGDPIDPIGDIREMNKIHCMLKPNGLLYLGFSVGVDKIAYNAHRIYGRMRLAMMFED